MTDELRNTDRRKVELHVQLLAAQDDLKTKNQKKEIFKSAYERTWLCLHKPRIDGTTIVNDNAFSVATLTNKS